MTKSWFTRLVDNESLCCGFQDATTAMAETNTKKRKAPVKPSKENVRASPVVRRTRRNQIAEQVMQYSQQLLLDNRYYLFIGKCFC